MQVGISFVIRSALYCWIDSIETGGPASKKLGETSKKYMVRMRGNRKSGRGYLPFVVGAGLEAEAEADTPTGEPSSETILRLWLI